jgi:hypothetical protein
MSYCPRTAEELTVTNPFESMAGRKISMSTGAFCSCAFADDEKPAAAVTKIAAARHQ